MSCDLTGSTNIDITDGVISATGLQNEIDDDTSINLTSITSNDLVINESLNIDSLITYEKYKQFNTIVIRRFDETNYNIIALREIQYWVNDINILPPNSDDLIGYFANWSNNGVELEPSDAGTSTIRYVLPYMVDDTLTSGTASQSDPTTNTNAMIIKNIPSTFVNDIQALVLFDRLSSSSQISPVGLIIELYNSINDPTLIEPLATTTIISTKEDNYRYNFPSIGKYGG